MVVASAALIVALGGTSYAVATGSVDSRAVDNNSIKSKDVKDRSLTKKDLRKSLRGALWREWACGARGG
ncbi:MAG: hypothetical protein ACRDMA_14370 [Solirubrobacterales bacterium]